MLAHVTPTALRTDDGVDVLQRHVMRRDEPLVALHAVGWPEKSSADLEVSHTAHLCMKKKVEYGGW